MTPEQLTAISGLVTGVLGIVIALFTAISSVKKSEIEGLRSAIELLQAENARLSARVETLQTQNDSLRAENIDLKERVNCLEQELEDAKKWKKRQAGGLKS